MESRSSGVLLRVHTIGLQPTVSDDTMLPTMTKIPASPLLGSQCIQFFYLHWTMTTATAIGLLIGRIWRRTQARIRGTHSGVVSPRTSTVSLSPSPTTRLPQEVVEIIIVYLIFDTSSLLACSLTCRSWYIAAVPHLHHTLITPVYYGRGDEKRWWPDSFRSMHELGLFPLIKRFQVPGSDEKLSGPRTFSPTQFDHRILRQYLSLVNVQELGIDYLDIPSFMLNIRRYFGHFAPTVRSLALREPKGSRRQIVFFIGLFQHLEDLKLLYTWIRFRKEPADDLTLVPSFAPPLRGRLTMTCFTRVGILEDMIELFGGIRFHYMDLFCVRGMRLLLDACTETLETLRLYPHDPHSERLSLKDVGILTNDFAVKSSPRDFDLSRNKFLRTLEITARYTILTTASNLNYALSTIKSLVFSKVIVFYRDYDFMGVDYSSGPRPIFGWSSPYHREMGASNQRMRLPAFREMYKVREFELVLCADVWHRLRGHTMRELNRAVAAERAERGFDDLPSEPLVTYSPRLSLRVLSETWSHGAPPFGCVSTNVAL